MEFYGYVTMKKTNKNSLIFYQTLPTISFRKYMEITLENFMWI